jgi:hypothetical protein
MFIDGKEATYQLPWLNAMLPILLLEELVMANWQIQMFQNSLLEVFSNA